MEQDKENRIEFFEFVLNNCHYGIELSNIIEVSKPLPITKMPCASPSILGITMPRENLITVIDLKRVLYHIYADTVNFMIVLQHKDDQIALVVDNIIALREIDKSELVQPDLDVKVAKGVCTIDNNIVTLLDFEMVMKQVH